MWECRQVDNNDYSKRACDSLYWYQVTMADLTGTQQTPRTFSSILIGLVAY